VRGHIGYISKWARGAWNEGGMVRSLVSLLLLSAAVWQFLQLTPERGAMLIRHDLRLRGQHITPHSLYTFSQGTFTFTGLFTPAKCQKRL